MKSVLPKSRNKKFKAATNGDDSRQQQQPLQVFCRLRPLKPSEDGVSLDVLNDTELSIKFSNGKTQFFKFNQIFTNQVSQNQVFNCVCQPLVKDLLNGLNGLLFTYGVTSSGKTHTVTGSPTSPGLLPLTLDVLFNTLDRHNLQSHVYSFKPDNQYGFDIITDSVVQSELADVTKVKVKLSSNARKPSPTEQLHAEWKDRIREYSTFIEEVNTDNYFAVFVSFVEIYNNYVYDLLEESPLEVTNRVQTPQAAKSKNVREFDSRVFVQGVVEVEVKTSDDAFNQFIKGVARRRIAATALNAESSRSHSVFTIRVAQATKSFLSQLDSARNRVHVSQLSIVDLAGCERAARTNANNNQIKEASNINSSLMSLRACFDVLRYNQRLPPDASSRKIVPYRDNKLTHLFKNYFEGDGAVKMILCLSPSSNEVDETANVLKFGEQSQEIVTTKGITAPLVLSSTNFTFNSYDFEPFPARLLAEDHCPDPDDAQLYPEFVGCMESRRDATYKYLDAFYRSQALLRVEIESAERENGLLADENARKRNDLDAREQQLNELQERYRDNDEQVHKLSDYNEQLIESNEELQRKIDEYNQELRANREELETMQRQFREHLDAEKNRLKKWYENWLKQKEEEMKRNKGLRNEKLKLVRDILNSENGKFHFDFYNL